MKKFYIIVAHTGTVLSRLIRLYTKDEYSHVSLALDSELEQMYSFGRKNAYNPFFGGFVHEGIHWGTFKRFYKTRVKVMEIDVDDEQYEILKRTIDKFKAEKSEYGFNYLGMFATAINLKLRFKNRFYCAEFVKHMVDTAQINADLPELVRPESFKNFANSKVVYTGLLRDYVYTPLEIEVLESEAFATV